MAGMVWIALAGPAIMEAMARMLIQGLRFDKKDVLNFAPDARAYELLGLIAVPIGGIMVATLIAAIAAPAMLGSLGFRANAFAPKPEKLNPLRSEEHTSELQSIMRISYAVFCLKNNTTHTNQI